MDLHVVAQVSRRWKRSWTLWTWVRLVLGESISQINIIKRVSTNLDVCHPVVVKIGAGCETFSTGFTLVRLLPSVDSSVSVQRRTGRESFLAEVTDIWPG